MDCWECDHHVRVDYDIWCEALGDNVTKENMVSIKNGLLKPNESCPLWAKNETIFDLGFNRGQKLEEEYIMEKNLAYESFMIFMRSLQECSTIKLAFNNFSSKEYDAEEIYEAVFEGIWNYSEASNTYSDREELRAIFESELEEYK